MRVEAGGRWDALALLHALADKLVYLVAVGRDRWQLFVERSGSSRFHAAPQSELELRIGEWLSRRALAQTSLRLPDGSCTIVHAAAPPDP